MLTCPTHLPISFCTEPVDSRKSFDGLTGVIASVFQTSVLTGQLFLFINKRHDRIKALWWDRDGLVIFYKRLEMGTFEMPTRTDQATHLTLDATQLSMLLGGVSLSGVWKSAHPEFVRTYRTEERRDASDRTRVSRAKRRLAIAKQQKSK